MRQKTCGEDICKQEHGRQLSIEHRRKAEAKKEREVIRQRKEALKGFPDYKKELDDAFSAYIRYRDKDKPCICCGMPLNSSGMLGSIGGGCDAGHYIPRKHMAVRWDEVNVNAQRKYCNKHLAGNYAGYREGLIARYGISEVERLERARKEVKKWTIPELIEKRDLYKQKLRELKKGQ
jgi:hypothetical protein